MLLSELMLQQTRVDTVVPYFERFLAMWPTLEAFARATEDEVLKAWAGLGYYSRARNLLACAQKAAADGGLPQDVPGLEALPGIGPYTAGAVASIAFGVSAPVVDGNVERVLSRLDGRSADPRSTQGRKALWARAQQLHDATEASGRHGDLNQALMELGATVCTPRRPQCSECPVRPHCVVRASGEDPESLPVRAARRKPTLVRGVAGLLRIEGGVVMGRRPPGLLGGMWEPISLELDKGDALRPSVVRAFSERCGLAVQVAQRRGQVVHTFTHRKLTCTVYDVRGQGEPRALDYYTEVRVVRDPADVALSTLARRILALGPQLSLPLAADGD